MIVQKLLILSNCLNQEYLGSGYVINNFKKKLEQYYEVDYYDIANYELLKSLGGRGTIYRQSLGKVFLLALLWVKGKRYDIIEFWGGDSFLAILFAKWMMKHTLLVHHSNGLESKYVPILQNLEGGRKWYQINLKPLYDLTITKVYGIVTMTNDEANWVQKNYAKKSVGIPAGLHPDFKDLPINYTAKENIIGFVGTWLPKKGIDAIIKNIPLILHKYPSYRLQLIGVGDVEVVINQFPEHIRKQIEIVPFVKNKHELLAYYLKMKVFILPSKAESFGLVTIEAMAAGCAVIASNIGFVTELENYREVLKLDEANDASLYNCLDAILSNRDLMIQLAQNGYDKVQQLQWDKLGKQLADLYRQWYVEFNNF